MMPILWRYLLRHYFKTLFLCLTSFVAILLVTRFKDIAYFASSGASTSTMILFALHQIPYILPIALPVSSLIAPILLFQRLSHTHELIALRAAGISLKTILQPIVLAGGMLSLLNFLFISEITPLCRSRTKELIYSTTEKNPLFLTQKESLIRVRDVHFDIGSFDPGKAASDALIVHHNRTSNRLGLLLAKKFSLEKGYLKGDYVGIISSSDSKQKDAFDHLIIENQKTMATKASNLSPYIQSLDSKASYDYMPMRLLLAKKLSRNPTQSRFYIGKSDLEIIKRLSYGLAAFTFTFIGAAFGMDIGRTHKKKGILTAIILAGFTLICFLAAKSVRHSPLFSMAAYLLPHPIVYLFCLNYLRRITKGVEA